MPFPIYPPQDALYNEQWYLQTMKVPQAWQLLMGLNEDITYGSTGITIGILDQGIKSDMADGRLLCVHPDFIRPLAGGIDKIKNFYDFSVTPTANNNNTVTESHGMYCAGVAAAGKNNGAITGMIGVAPNCRLIAGKRSEETSDGIMADMLLTMGGFVKTNKGWIKNTFGGSDIISCSFNWLYNGENYEPAEKTLRAAEIMKLNGRKGKGTIVVVAAGNNNEEISVKNLLPKYTNCIVVGASTIIDGEETFAPYTNYSDEYAKVDICAPSSIATGDELQTNPVDNRGIITTSLMGAGNILHNHHVNYFGGTSAAAPMVAGVVALMLTANPDLTAQQVKQILRDTADVIDRSNTDEFGQWVSVPGNNPGNTRPDVYSKRMGYGRVNAEKAVFRAINMLYY